MLVVAPLQGQQSSRVRWLCCPLQCTVTCGRGLRYRVVLCIDHRGQHVGGCNPQLKLHIKEECIVPIPCYKPKGNWNFVWVCYCFFTFLFGELKAPGNLFQKCQKLEFTRVFFFGFFSVLAGTSTLIIGARKSALLIFFADNVARLS